MTQPRRIAAVSVSEFIAAQLKTTIPDTVGFKMRFEDRTDASTKIKIMTDGILLQELKADYDLSKYQVIMVDEAHERSLNIDFILGLLKNIIKRRQKFRVVVSSATINAEVFSEYFDECPIVKIDALAYPIDIFYKPPHPENNVEALIKKIITTVSDILDQKEDGDILIFLSGEAIIKNCIRQLQKLPWSSAVQILPLYSRLSYQDQQKVFKTFPGKKKIIVSTNISETSVTIDGVTWVIDSGLAKMNFYNPHTYTSSLEEIPISKASCNQRKGRSGRTNPGICFRLYTQDDYEHRPLFTREEIFRTDLSEVILRMTELGIKDYEGFNFISPPGREKILSAIETLKLLDAIDEHRNLTKIGEMMCTFPITPKLSRMIVEAILRYPRVLEEILIAASFLSTNSPFLLPHGQELEARQAHHNYAHPYGDFISYLKIFRSFSRQTDGEFFCKEFFFDVRTMREIIKVQAQLVDIVGELNIPIQSGGDYSEYLCAVARGLIQFVCVQQKRRMYRSLTAEKIQIHPGSVLFNSNPRFIVAGEIVRTSRMYARTVSLLRPEWFQRISPLLSSFLQDGENSDGKRTHKRDFSDRIKIGSEVFSIQRERGNKKVVILPWEKIRPLAETVDTTLLPDYRGLRGKITFQQYEILSGTRIQTILHIVPKIELKHNIIHSWPHSLSIHQPKDIRTLGRFAEKLLNPCLRKKKSKKLGFLSLHTDGAGKYWFKCSKSYHAAIIDTLSSLEKLADDMEENQKKANGNRIASRAVLTRTELDHVNKIYRNLQSQL